MKNRPGSQFDSLQTAKRAPELGERLVGARSLCVFKGCFGQAGPYGVETVECGLFDGGAGSNSASRSANHCAQRQYPADPSHSLTKANAMILRQIRRASPTKREFCG
jgi:hypothetical protein